MADSLDRVGHRVDMTTTAVVGMQAAIIKAEKEAADRVCADVNRGFYALIQSQISQKIAKLQSTVDSHLLALNRQMAQLTAIRGRMDRDYGMLTSRYMKLFQTINRNLYRRICELDKPVMDFASKEMSCLDNRTVQQTATVPVAQQEGLTASQRIVVANIKSRCEHLVELMKKYLSDDREQKALSASVLLEREQTVDRERAALPVVVMEGVQGPGMTTTDIRISRRALPADVADRVEAGVNRLLPSMKWRRQATRSRAVDREFDKLLGADTSSERVKRVIEYLYKSSVPQTLKD